MTAHKYCSKYYFITRVDIIPRPLVVLVGVNYRTVENLAWTGRLATWWPCYWLYWLLCVLAYNAVLRDSFSRFWLSFVACVPLSRTVIKHCYLITISLALTHGAAASAAAENSYICVSCHWWRQQLNAPLCRAFYIIKSRSELLAKEGKTLHT